MALQSQKQRLYNYLLSHKSITRRDAVIHLGIMELSSRIGELERDGIKISHTPKIVNTKWGKTSVVEYSLIKEQK